MFLSELTRKLAHKKRQDEECPKNIVRKFVLVLSEINVFNVPLTLLPLYFIFCRNNHREPHKCLASQIFKETTFEEGIAYEN